VLHPAKSAVKIENSPYKSRLRRTLIARPSGC